ncbi:hypothetical protein, partial [Pantoea septica]|uniref:hypothetical protein n=2 Tax=Erwiniaceae TaxID=1903409 RepID=UPI0023F63264
PIMFIENKPDEIELLSFFESEPVSFDRENISYSYRVVDKKRIELEFSFSVIEGWIQYSMNINGQDFLHGYIDGVNSFGIKKDKDDECLYAEIITDKIVTKLEIRVRPDISIKSRSLVK